MLTVILSIAWSPHGGWLTLFLLLWRRWSNFLFRTLGLFSPLLLLLLLVSLLILLLLDGFLLHFLLLLHLNLSFPFLVSLLLLNKGIANLFGQVEIHSVVFDKSGECFPTVINLTQLYEQRNKIKKLPILWVIIPRNNSHGTLWLQHVS